MTTQGCYKFLVAPMGFCNSAATFQRSIDNCLNGIDGVIAYQDDILVFADTWEQHCRIVKQVLLALRSSAYYCNPAKTEIGVRSVEFLGHRIGYGEKSMQESKIAAIAEWPTPKSVKALQRFLGATNFYRSYIRNYSSVVLPLTSVTGKKGFVWGEEQQQAFEKLKVAMISRPCLHSVDHDAPFQLSIEADSSGEAMGAVLQQNGKPVAYF